MKRGQIMKEKIIKWKEEILGGKKKVLEERGKNQEEIIGENPYVAGRREWFELYGDIIEERDRWVKLGIILIGINIILIGTVIYTALRCKLVPFVVYVDQVTGQIGRTTEVHTENIQSEAILKSQMYRFIEKARTIPWDQEVLLKNLQEAYGLVASKEVRVFLDRYYQGENPFDVQRYKTRSVTILSCLRESKNSFLIEWEEQDNEKQGGVSTHRWKALISVSQKGKGNIQDYLNPLGIYVYGLSWSEVPLIA